MTNVCFISHGRLRLLQQALESLYANTDRKEFNCTVVSDSEDDFRCTRLLKRYAVEERNFALVEVNSNHVLAQLKNLAVFWSRQRFGCGDWLHLGDADVCFMPGWLDRLTFVASVTELSGFRLWGGQIHPFHQPVANIERDNELILTEHAILDGPSWFMCWSTWRKFGPLDRASAPGVCQSEEFPFCQRLIDSGGRIGVVRPNIVIHAGLTNSNGQLAPGANERRPLIPAGVYAE